MEPQQISSDLIRGHIDTIILHTLLDGDKFAQQISESVEAKSENEYKINQATLYSSLKRLESLKHVTSYWNDSSNGRRKYFKLTEAGKKSVENNLSNWSYSRAIIDKLMDCAPTPIYKTQYVEKVVEVEKIVEVEKKVSSTTEQNTVNNSVEQQVQTQPQQSSINNSSENSQEINFRNILNGLIQASASNKPQQTELEPIKKSNEQENADKIEVQKFNETIISTDYNANRNNNGKIDFGDLTLKAAKEGYKLRISSKYSYIKNGNLLINKLNLISCLTVYVLSLIVFLILGASFNAQLNLDAISIISIIALLSVYPIIVVVKYLKAPNKTTNVRINTDGILTSAIVVFNLLLITVAINLLFSVDFGQTKTILFSLVFPSVLFVFSVIYYTIRYLYSKTSIVKVQDKIK